MGATVLADDEGLLDLASAPTATQTNSPVVDSRTDDSTADDSTSRDSTIGESSQAPQSSLPTSAVEPVSSTEKLKRAVLQALADGNQPILVSMLEAGEWWVDGNEVVIKVIESRTVVDMSLGADARRLAIASASGVLGRAVKLKIVPGANAAVSETGNGGPKANGANAATGRSRAESDAVVRRLQDKFGAQIRTVIDYREKR